jgi:hypothetical protein
MVTVAALFLAAIRPKSRSAKAAAVLVVVAVFGYIPITDGWDIYKARTRLAKAEAMFQERCKVAGEKIHRTAENVDGIFLMKVRPGDINRDEQFKMDDPYGRDLGGEGYIETFVRGSYELMRPKNPRPGWPSRLGYRYVEAIDPKDGRRYRYTGRIDEPWKYDSSYSTTYKRFVLDKISASDPAPRYGVTYDDISTREEREVWIAGSSLKVVDLQTNEIMAERIGYMMDLGQGATGGGRAPWLLAAANACPDFHRFPNPVVVVPGADAQPRQAQDFVEKVLKPILEN